MTDPLALIALDLDGTVLFEDESVAPKLLAALRRLNQHPGVEIVFATGRSLDAALRVVANFGLRLNYLVACNGAVTVQYDAASGKWQRQQVRTFDAAPMLQNLYARMPHAAIAVEGADGNFYYTEELPGKTLPNNRYRVSFAQLLQVTATRVVATSPAHSVSEFFAHMDELGYAHTAYVVGETAWLDAAPTGVHKASALEPIRDTIGADRQAVFAAGDGMNDIEMLTWARTGGGFAVAMGQGYPQVHECASFVAPSLDECGLLHGLRAWEKIAPLL